MNEAWETLIAILFALFGGFARLLGGKDDKQITKNKLLSEMFVSAFTGIMVLKVAHIAGLSGDWIGLVCGMSGWLGPKALDYILEFLRKALNVAAQKEAKKDE